MPSLSSIIGQASRGADLYFVFRFLRLLTMDWKKTDAYKFKIIDSKGKALRKSADLASTKEKASYTMLHRMVFKIRRLMEKIPGGRFVNYAAALFLLKEQKDARIWTDDIYMKTKLLEFLETDWEADAKFLKEEVDNMDKKSFKTFLSEKKTIEESQELQALMALDDAGIEAVIDKKGQIVIDKKDKKNAEKALKKSFRKGGAPEIQYEEVELSEEVADIMIRKGVGKMSKQQVAGKVMTNARKLFKNDFEKNLYKKINDLRKYFTSINKDENYELSLSNLAESKSIIFEFFDNVIVNDEDKTIQKNRLELLQMLCKTFDNYLNFSTIEISK